MNTDTLVDKLTDIKHAFGCAIDRLLHRIRVWLVLKDVIPAYRDSFLSHDELVRKYGSSWNIKATREELLSYSNHLFVELGLRDDELVELGRRWENNTRLANSYMEGRVKIIRELERFGLALLANNEIEGRARYQPKIVPGKPAPKTPPPIMAKGLIADPIPEISYEDKPIIAWYRLIREKQKDGTELMVEHFNHFQDVEEKDIKRNKHGKIDMIALPEKNTPPSKAGTHFTGKWVYKFMKRTEETCPKISALT
jgi:hypothetical protein